VNEQIEQCLYQAGLTAQGCWDELDDYTKQGIENFALLIVKECAAIVASSSLPDAYSEPCLLGIADEIKHHFGVIGGK
jgi:hypothetical protein